MDYTYLFGPVQSRRLGVSLGIDLVSSKTCSLDCVYCECGKTTDLTLARHEYADADAIIAEIGDYLGKTPKLDYVTFGGSGEPTLNTGIGRIVRFIKEKFPRYRCALLTNGTLLYLPGVREALLPFNLVLPNLDAVSDAVFRRINRPHPGLDNSRVIEGLRSFRREYRGTIWLEIFIVPGINDTAEELRLLGEAARSVNPDRVQLNTLDRPGACDWVTGATPEALQAAARAFAPLPVEIISRQAQNLSLWREGDASPESVRSLIARRPSTIEEIASLTGLTINQTKALLSTLVESKKISPHSVNDRTFYQAF
jgi:wyosine [tRNA(Phe)-imidazoG37] synthetase (radical SAM superfamily)